MSKVSTKETIELQDGTKVELRPLNIKNYRAFQETWAAFVQDESEDKSELDFLVSLVQICLRKPLGEQVDDLEWLEEALDSEAINYIIKVCAGLDLNPDQTMVTAMAARSGQSSN
jgi:hypothetical protein